MRPLRIPLRTLRLKKREFNRKDAEKCKVRKVQFHAVYSILHRVFNDRDYVSHKGTKDTKEFTAVETPL